MSSGQPGIHDETAESAVQAFGPATRAWFEASFAGPTRVQTEGWPRIRRGEHTLLLAPTGSGKTLAAFLSCIDRLAHTPRPPEPPRRRRKKGEAAVEEGPPRGFRVIYVSPLKALVYDIERNLRAPLIGVEQAAVRLDVPVQQLQVDIRTGDTPSRERQRMVRHPGDILVTTPESLYLMLTSQARETFRTVETIILDEIHVMAGTKRGVHLALTLERLAELCSGPDGEHREPQRIGLSATQRPLDVVARYLGGDRPVSVVDTSEPPRLELDVVVPVDDMDNPPRPMDVEAASRALEPSLASPGLGRPPRSPRVATRLSPTVPITSPLDGVEELEARAREAPKPSVMEGGLWPSIYPRMLEQIRAHRSTIVFTNSRLLCERLAQKINDLAGEDIVRTHHGSISHEQRKEVEELLKEGKLPALIATSSLELGIDMGAVDLVILVESPGTSARGLQRVGRAGHGVGQTSRGTMFPKFKGDLLECAVVSSQMLEGEIEATRPPKNCLDVLAQHIVAMVAMGSVEVDKLHRTVRRAAPFADISRELFDSVLDMLSGRYPSDEFAELTPRINWNRTTDVLSPRRGARMTAVLNGGTIPDKGLYTVHLGPDGPKLGELDEEMVYETRQGDVIILGASSWRAEEITRDRVIVSPAPGEPGRLPFWRGERPGRPIELGRAVGGMLSTLEPLSSSQSDAWLAEHTVLDERARKNLVRYVDEQKAINGGLPTDRAITIERFRDELGDWRVCILTPFGTRVHAPWALALEATLSQRAGFEVDLMYSDDGIALRLADTEELPETDDFFPEPEELEDLIVEQLSHSALFASRFRENAARALLLPKRRAQGRTPLWLQRRRSQALMAVATRFPQFPIVLETYRECLQDVFDLPSLATLLDQVRRREVRVDDIETKSASPFARSLVFQYIANYLYDGDAPLAERKAQALALDRNLLRELLGQEELRDLLDKDAVAEVERELQRLEPERRARHADGVHDLLRRLGDLSLGEVDERTDGDPDPWLRSLEETRRVVSVRIAGEPRYIAAEDAARYRDAFGVNLPVGLPEAFLHTVEQPLESLVLRYARTHGPFHTGEVASRYGLTEAMVDTLLRSLEARDLLVHGELRPGGTRREWCDPEVLRKLKRRSLARLRREVAPVDADVFARFLPAWQGVVAPGTAGRRRRGRDRLLEVVDQLEGLPLSFTALEAEILPVRIDAFHPRELDELGASGEVVWIGAGSLGRRDGKVRLYRRDRVPLLVDVPVVPEGIDEEARGILDHLQQRGACFVSELARAAPSLKQAELLDALWSLAWAGIVTNDTFHPLRALSAAKGRSRRGQPTVGGRWSLVADLVGHEVVRPTERAHARVMSLLERYGVIARESAAAAELPGGFSAIYPVLREMEEMGRVRRGMFIDGLGGAQFALEGAVDRLRGFRVTPDVEQPLVLAGTDPANPWGSVLPWPERADDGPKPRRVASSLVVLELGMPVLFSEKRSLVTFPGTFDDVERLERAVAALLSVDPDRSRRFQRVDGVDALQSPHAEALVAAGFQRDYRGLVLSRS